MGPDKAVGLSSQGPDKAVGLSSQGPVKAGWPLITVAC